jgi:hypothetical protein
MAIADSNQGGELAGLETRVNVLADICCDSLGLPWRQAALSFCSPAWRNNCIPWELCWLGAIKQMKGE